MLTWTDNFPMNKGRDLTWSSEFLYRCDKRYERNLNYFERHCDGCESEWMDDGSGKLVLRESARLERETRNESKGGE